MNVVFGIAKKLEENSVITEGVFSWLKDKFAFVKAFLKALKQIGCSVVDKQQFEALNHEALQQDIPFVQIICAPNGFTVRGRL